MSGRKDKHGERERCPVHGHGRRLSQENIREIRRWTDIENSRARRRGVEAKDPKITMFSCSCNCFNVDVE
ncbi:hypothetical protein DB30_04900 [Enhygromyxa salina]|uniref:Uncharacterized protein n=1 Tax=Enhygromyxa salina TaxID=215803 RepID=A0A0C2D852_9BACT|nr:hypothetical protein DB30_04900 [Enhygromyxa salina]